MVLDSSSATRQRCPEPEREEREASSHEPEPLAAQGGKAEFKLKLMGIDRTLDPWTLFAEWAWAVELNHGQHTGALPGRLLRARR